LRKLIVWASLILLLLAAPALALNCNTGECIAGTNCSFQEFAKLNQGNGSTIPLSGATLTFRVYNESGNAAPYAPLIENESGVYNGTFNITGRGVYWGVTNGTFGDYEAAGEPQRIVVVGYCQQNASMGGGEPDMLSPLLASLALTLVFLALLFKMPAIPWPKGIRDTEEPNDAGIDLGIRIVFLLCAIMSGFMAVLLVGTSSFASITTPTYDAATGQLLSATTAVVGAESISGIFLAYLYAVGAGILLVIFMVVAYFLRSYAKAYYQRATRPYKSYGEK